jgi:hypothetical protein
MKILEMNFSRNFIKKRWKIIKKGTSTMNFFSRAGHHCHTKACRSAQNYITGTSRGARDNF